MGIQEIGQGGKEGVQAYPGKRQQKSMEGFQESLLQNLRSREQDTSALTSEKRGSGLTGGEAVQPARERTDGVGVVHGAAARIRVKEAVNREAVQTAEVRHMRYEESDHVEIAVAEGYALKGKREGQQVYVEAKYEDGRVEAYHVDTGKVQEQTQHRIERFALETVGARSSEEFHGATDTVGVILAQMAEPTGSGPVTMSVIHDGVQVLIQKDAFYGNMITIGGSAKPDWVSVSTSVGTVRFDLNDLDSLMKCLDMFSPEDVNAILRKITEVRQSRDALQEIDDMKNTPVQRAQEEEEEEA